VLAEANARGVPTMSFNLDGPNEIIIPDENGYLVYGRSMEEFVVMTSKILNKSFNKQLIQKTAFRFSERSLIDFIINDKKLKALFCS
jgi:glycosyltransferase involved in cell wall biosynthesis